MAQTWPVSRARIAALKFVDLIGRTLAWPLRGRRRLRLPIERVLVIEPWNIGDVVLVTPLLSQLRARLPNAAISLLARDHARDLLAGTGLVDEIIVTRLPWTAPKKKYRITPAVAKEMRDLVKKLRRRRFDVSIDARMDIRSNLLAAATGARQRIGYDIGGGGWLLTHALPSHRDGSHKVDDWLALLDCLDLPEPATTDETRPELLVTQTERALAEKTLRAAAGDKSPTIGYHPGGSHPGKRWPRGQFESLIDDLRESLGGRHIVFLGPDEQGEAGFGPGVVVMRPGLRDLMAHVSCCDVLVCNDSGPMHVADALDIPVVAIFEMGNPQWFGPSGPRSRVVCGQMAGIGMSAAPLDRPPANPVPVSRVAAAVKKVLAQPNSQSDLETPPESTRGLPRSVRAIDL